MSDARALTERERALNVAARVKSYIPCDGEHAPHRSCGLAAAPGATSPESGQRGAP
jgi:hypothetical protein